MVRRLLPAQEQSQTSQNLIVSCAANLTSLRICDPVDVCMPTDKFVPPGGKFELKSQQVDTGSPGSAWLDGPDCAAAAFFSKVDTATDLKLKLSCLSWDASDNHNKSLSFLFETCGATKNVALPKGLKVFIFRK